MSDYIHQTFKSSTGARATLQVDLWPKLGKIEMWIEQGNECSATVVLKGEDLGKFIAWVKEQGFTV